MPGWKSKNTREEHKSLQKLVDISATAMAKALTLGKKDITSGEHKENDEDIKEKVKNYASLFTGTQFKISKGKLTAIHKAARTNSEKGIDGAKEFLKEAGNLNDFLNLRGNLVFGPVEGERNDDPNSRKDLFYYKTSDGSGTITPRSATLDTMEKQLNRKRPDYPGALSSLQSVKLIKEGSLAERMSRSTRSFQPSGEATKPWEKRARTPSPSRQQQERKEEATGAKSAADLNQQRKPSSGGGRRR